MTGPWITALLVLTLNSVGLSEISYGLMAIATLWLAMKNRRHIADFPNALIIGFGLMVVLGAVGFREHGPYDAGKDAWYFTKPLVEIAFGFFVGTEISLRGFCALIVVDGMVAATYHLGHIASDYDEYFALMSSDIDAARATFGFGDFATVFSLIILFEESTRGALFNSRRRPLLCVTLGVLFLLSMIATGSRTLAAALVLWGVIKLFRHKKRVALLLAACMGTLIVASMTLSATGIDLSEYGIRDPIQELTIEQYDTEEEINTNWRGFESFLALAQFASFSTEQQLFGGGFGQLVALDRERQLGSESFDEIPLLHNGYIYVLVKVGLCGLLIFVSILVSMALRVRRSRTLVDPGVYGIHMWTVLVAAFTTLIIAGVFNVSELRTILIAYGYLLSTETCEASRSVTVANENESRVPTPPGTQNRALATVR